MTWNESGGTVSRAFSDWLESEEQNRAFLNLTAKWAAHGYQQEWEEKERSLNEVFDPERHYGDEHVGWFDEAVGGLWPDGYAWMAEAAVLRNAVTAFELYLEQALLEVISRVPVRLGEASGHLGWKLSGSHTSPAWPDIQEAYKILGTPVDTDPVIWVRGLRHVLVHQNGELRTKKQRERFGDATPQNLDELPEDSLISERVTLGVQRVVKSLDSLAGAVRRVDPSIWCLYHGDRRNDRESVWEIGRAGLLAFVPAKGPRQKLPGDHFTDS